MPSAVPALSSPAPMFYETPIIGPQIGGRLPQKPPTHLNALCVLFIEGANVKSIRRIDFSPGGDQGGRILARQGEQSYKRAPCRDENPGFCLFIYKGGIRGFNINQVFAIGFKFSNEGPAECSFRISIASLSVR